MWIINRHGFFSAVEDRNDATMLWVRTRAEEHAESLVKGLNELRGNGMGVAAVASAKVVASKPTADYPFRVHCSKRELGEMMRAAVEAIDYDNFKNMLHDERGPDPLLEAAHEIWDVLRTTVDTRYNGQG